MDTTTHSHIDTVPNRCGGRPCIKGTRIRVWDIHVMHNLQGYTPAEIITAYPQLTLADVHAALTYYLDHRALIEQQAESDRQLIQNKEAAQGPTRFTLLRDELARGKDAREDSLPS